MTKNAEKVAAFLGAIHQPQPLPDIFQKYAGMVIPHEDYDYTFKHDPEQKKYKMQRPNEEGEALIREIYQVAADNNVSLRLWTPDVMGTMDVQHSRLNMHVDVGHNSGEWIIKNECDYG